MLDHYHFVGDPRSPKLGSISFCNALATSAAISVVAGNASIHSEHVSTSTERELKLPVLSACEISLPVFPGICPSGLNGPNLGSLGGLVLGLFTVQMAQVSTI